MIPFIDFYSLSDGQRIAYFIDKGIWSYEFAENIIKAKTLRFASNFALEVYHGKRLEIESETK